MLMVRGKIPALQRQQISFDGFGVGRIHHYFLQTDVAANHNPPPAGHRMELHAVRALPDVFDNPQRNFRHTLVCLQKVHHWSGGVNQGSVAAGQFATRAVNRHEPTVADVK